MLVSGAMLGMVKLSFGFQIVLSALDFCQPWTISPPYFPEIAPLTTHYLYYSYRLVDVIVEDHFEHLGLEKHFVEVLPETITLNQTVALWKCIVNYQDKTSLI